MRARIILLCVLLLAGACSQKKSTPVEDAIRASVSARLGELNSMEFSELTLVDSTSVAYIWRFSARAFPINGGCVSIDKMYVAITPENRIVGMDYTPELLD